MKRYMLVCLIGIFSFWIAYPTFAASTPLCSIEIRGMDKLIQNIKTLGRMPEGNMDFIRMSVYDMLQADPDADTLDGKDSVRVLVYVQDLMECGPQFVFILPLNGDGSEYVQGLEAKWERNLEVDGLPEGVWAYTSRMSGEELFLLRKGSRLMIVGDRAENVAGASKALDEGTIPAILPVEGDIAMTWSPSQFLSLLDAAMQEDEEFQWMRDMQAAIWNQLESESVGIGLSNGILSVHDHIVPAANSILADYIKTLSSISTESGIATPENAWMAANMNVGDVNLWVKPYFNWVMKAYQLLDAPLDLSIVQTWFDEAEKSISLLSGPASFSILPPQAGASVRILEYVGTKHPEQLRELSKAGMRQGREYWAEYLNSFQQVCSAMDISTMNVSDVKIEEKGTQEVHGVPVDSYALSMSFLGILDRDFPFAIPAELSMEYAYLPDAVLYSVGDSRLIHDALAAERRHKPTPVMEHAAWKALFPHPDQQMVAAGIIQLFPIARLVGSKLGMPLSIPADAGSGTVAMEAYRQNDSLMKRVRIRLADVHVLMDVMQQVSMATQPDFSFEEGIELEEREEVDLFENPPEGWVVEGDVITLPNGMKISKSTGMVLTDDPKAENPMITEEESIFFEQME